MLEFYFQTFILSAGPQSVPARIRANRGIESALLPGQGVARPGETDRQSGPGQRQSHHHRLHDLLQVEEHPHHGGQFVQPQGTTLAATPPYCCIVYLTFSRFLITPKYK